MADGETIISIRERLLKERNALLDLSTRNRLLNTPLRVRNNRAIEIVDEKSTEVFRLLDEGKALTFLPGIQLSDEDKAELEADDFETGGIPQPDDEGTDERGHALRHVDLKLQTRLTSEGLQKRLFDVWYDAHTLEEEQGVNILYLAIGLLRWFDSPTSDIARHAPLVLLPVQLERSSAAERFKLKNRQEPPSPNLTLQAKLKAEFGLTLEDFQDEDALELESYFKKAAETVAKQDRWEVLPDAMVLGFFSFAKFLMYRDLDPDLWPIESAIDNHSLITALLRDGFPESEPLVVGDTDPIDGIITPLALNHVVDADSSQAVAIAEAAGGRTLVVKGPPGTGKSQTITNIIAAAVAQGKKVLFVAEKMAALEVVHRRLRQVGLGPLALELHSNKANKRSILEELKRTKEATLRPVRGDSSIVEQLGRSREELNDFAGRLHTPLQPCGLTPREIIGRLVHHSGRDVGISDYTLDGASDWKPTDVDERRQRVSEIVSRLVPLGSPGGHPWYGVGCGPLDPDEVRTITRKAQAARDALSEARAAVAAAAELIPEPPSTIRDLHDAVAVMSAAVALPDQADRAALVHPAWAGNVVGLERLVERGEARAAAMAAVGDSVFAPIWPADLGPIRTAVVTKGAKLLRFLDGDYKSKIALLRSYVSAPLPKSVVDRLALIDRVIEAQQARAAFDETKDLGTAFGARWQEAESNWENLHAQTTWAKERALTGPALARLAAASDMRAIARTSADASRALSTFQAQFGELTQKLAVDVRRSLSSASLADASLATVDDRLAAWLNDPESLTRFIAFAARARDAASVGLGALMEAIYDGALDAKTLSLAFERAYADVLKAALFSAWPELKAFDGQTLDHMVAEFRRLDRARIEFAKEHIVARHAEERPKGLAGVGPLGVLNAELAKKRRFLPIRQLLERAGPAIQQLKPVFMMSPLSVAQYLKPGGLTFDLMVMDEASQIEPVDALGAIARAGQIVVVGDERQLPPTAFFKKLTGDADEEDEDDGVTIQAKDAESILDLCLAKGAPHRMLNWHYRSKHQSLIAVSNKEFYENKLFIVPSPYDAIAGMGLKFHLLSDAPYERGATRTNPIEARKVAEAVMQHARQTPELSLGVATFSVAQRQVVLKELELLRRDNPDLEDFFSRTAAEPFFVKNLENIQGDERDVVFISVGYGKTEQGYLAHNFGPLSGEGGERRLNVLISRAKLRCDVFCNFTGADIDPERSRARGVMALKMFLTFAETGKFGLGEETGLDHDSEFEAQVAERLNALGYDVKAQIGASGFRVDLAVSDPEKPGRFVLGIECDGAQYHSSRSARDRDRLRQQVLEAHGWIIHRIWSADWYLRPNEELRKIEAAIAAARGEWRERDEQGFSRSQAVPLSFEAYQEGDVDVISAHVGDPPASPTYPLYKEAQFPVNRATEPHEAPLAEMAAYVAKVVEVEGPIHLDEIATRIRTLWGLQKAGSRIRAAVARAADIASARGIILGGPFYTLPDQPILVRNRAFVSSSSLRRPEVIPPAEIEAAAIAIVDENYGAGRDELIQAIARAFGFASTSAQLRSVIERRIDHMAGTGGLQLREGLFVRPSNGG